MNAETHSAVAHPVVKVVSVWVAVGITSWADLAAFLAALYSFMLICEWLWKKLGRPFFEARGWLKRKKRRADDTWPG